VLTIAATSIVTAMAFRNYAVLERLLLSTSAILNGEWYRLLSSALVHGGWMHLLLNMFVLWSFGSFLETMIGTWRFGMLYVIGVLVASFTSVVMYRNLADYRAVGASGGVSAVIGAVTVLFPTLGMYVFFIPIAIPAWITAAAFMAYSVIGAQKMQGSIGHAAHLGGTVFGMGFAVAFYPHVFVQQWIYFLPMVAAVGIAYLYVRRQTIGR